MAQSVGISASGLCRAERYRFGSRSTREIVLDWERGVVV